MADVQRFKFKHLNANSAVPVNVSSGPCVLGGVQINTKGATANTLTLQDNQPKDATGNVGQPAQVVVIGVIDTTNSVGWLQYGVEILGQLQAIMNTGTPADITVTFQE
ncbi:MAG TPA: hypothetical protein VGM15_03255 [Burkholderiaceae bacterium]|jgi:hypothetical protein